MKLLQLNNVELKNILNECSDFFFSEKYSIIFNDDLLMGEFYCDVGHRENRETLSDNYINHLIKYPERHIGFPQGIKGIDIRHDKTPDRYFRKTKQFGSQYIKLWKEIQDFADDIDKKLHTLLSGKHSAYFTVYPKDGYIGWHSNHNASGHNILLSFSEQGTGYFEHIIHGDPEKKRIRHNDVKGQWTAKAGYFGSLSEPENICWHRAESGGSKRITISYIVPDKTMWELMCRDVETA